MVDHFSDSQKAALQACQAVEGALLEARHAGMPCQAVGEAVLAVAAVVLAAAAAAAVAAAAAAAGT